VTTDEWTPLRLVAMQAENHHASARSDPAEAMSHARFLADYLRGVGQRIDTPTLVGMIVATRVDDDLGNEAVAVLCARFLQGRSLDLADEWAFEETQRDGPPS
jgi:hypothetical protein